MKEKTTPKKRVQISRYRDNKEISGSCIDVRSEITVPLASERYEYEKLDIKLIRDEKNGVDYRVNIFLKTKKGNWSFGYSNDYPLQHGPGQNFSLPDPMVTQITQMQENHDLMRSLLKKIHSSGYSAEEMEKVHDLLHKMKAEYHD